MNETLSSIIDCQHCAKYCIESFTYFEDLNCHVVDQTSKGVIPRRNDRRSWERQVGYNCLEPSQSKEGWGQNVHCKSWNSRLPEHIRLFQFWPNPLYCLWHIDMEWYETELSLFQIVCRSAIWQISTNFSIICSQKILRMTNSFRFRDLLTLELMRILYLSSDIDHINPCNLVP